MNIRPEKWIGFMVSGSLHLGLAIPLISGGFQGVPAIEQQYDLQLSLFQDSLPANEITPETEAVDDIEEIEEEIEEGIVEERPEPQIQEIIPEPVAAPLQKEIKKKSPPPAPKKMRQKTTVPQISNMASLQNSGLIASEESQYQANLYRAIMAKKYYPRRAKSLKKQGIVLIKFTLTPDGSLHHLKILKSSGVASLDKSAQKAVRRVGKFPPFPPGIQRRSWTFEIPLEYEIT